MANGKTILIVDDDQSLLGLLGFALNREGYKAVQVFNANEALQRWRREVPDLVILDANMPERDGFEILQVARSEFNTPVLILSARTREEAMAQAFVAGADDYVTKPFRLAELLARVRALLRRGSTETPIVQGVRIDAESRRAWMGDQELQLTTKEFDLLRVLVRDAGKVVTREQIMREVWDTNWWGSTKTLDMHISWLRRKLGDDAGSPRYITTVRGVGFRFERGD